MRIDPGPGLLDIGRWSRQGREIKDPAAKLVRFRPGLACPAVFAFSTVAFVAFSAIRSKGPSFATLNT